jgi:hypothetical protein
MLPHFALFYGAHELLCLLKIDGTCDIISKQRITGPLGND